MTSPISENPYEAPRSQEFGTGEEHGDVPGSFAGKLAMAFRLYVGNFPLIALVVLTVWVPSNTLLELALSGNQELNDFLSVARFNNLIDSVLGPIVSGAVIGALAERVDGRGLGYRAAMVVGLRNWGRLFAARFFAGLLVLLGLIAFVVPGVFLAVRYSLIDQVVVLEGANSSESRARSADLVRGQGVHVIAAAVLIFALTMAASFGMAVLVESASLEGNLAVAVVIDCASDLIAALLICVFFVLYFDGRKRKLLETTPFRTATTLPSFLTTEPLPPGAER
jgi:hypothetical protein